MTVKRAVEEKGATRVRATRVGRGAEECARGLLACAWRGAGVARGRLLMAVAADGPCSGHARAAAAGSAGSCTWIARAGCCRAMVAWLLNEGLSRADWLLRGGALRLGEC